MYKLELTEECKDLFDNSNPEDCVYLWMGISQIYWIEASILCWIIDWEWINSMYDSKWLKKFKKSKLISAIEDLLCCWILELVDWELKFNKDRYMYMNDLWTKMEKEKYSKYIWIWTYDDVSKYEDMIKYVKKLVNSFKS